MRQPCFASAPVSSICHPQSFRSYISPTLTKSTYLLPPVFCFSTVHSKPPNQQANKTNRNPFPASMFSLGRAVSVCPADTSSSQKGSIMLCPPFLTSVPWSIALLMLLLLCPEKLLMSTEHSFVSHPFQHLGSTGFHPFLTF